MKQPQKILVIKLSALGDFILTTGMMKSIRDAYPKADITLMTNQKFIKIAEQSGWFKDYIVDNRTHKIRDYCRIIQSLTVGQFDLIFDLQIAGRTKRLYYFFTRILSKKSFKWASWITGGFNLKIIQKNYRLTWGKATEQFLPIAEQESSLAFCHGENKNFHLLPKKYVLLIPGCSPTHPYKRWPAKYYARLAQKLASRKIHTVVMGTEAERAEIEEICADNPYAVNFCNCSSLMDIPDLARGSVAVVGNDTGPTHMSSLVGKPVIALFCQITKSSALSLHNVHNIIRENIADISVDEVIKLLDKLTRGKNENTGRR